MSGTTAREAGREVARLIEVLARLRGPDGCPWDRKQSWNSLRRHVLEEAHELVDAVDRNDPDAVREECGDLLLEVVFLAQIAREEGRFGMAEVARGIVEKLVRRHPHVFGDGRRAADADEALAAWEAVKAGEGPRGKERPPALPALLFALKAVERRPDAGPEDLAGAVARLENRAADPDPETAFGDLLLAVVREAHRRGVDPESALRRTAARLERDRPVQRAAARSSS